MPEATVSRDGDDCLRLAGELTFSGIMAVREQSERLLSQMGARVEIDFSAITRSDSSALSFWLCCLRRAKTEGREIVARSVPDELRAMARLVGLDHHFE